MGFCPFPVFLRVTLLKVIVHNADFLENYEIFNTDFWFTLLVLLFVLEIFKKKKKKSSENDQSTGHFQSFFFFFFVSQP